MTSQGDPHRTLGVQPGASLNEIRSAYRRLAKQYHPDFAGERALSRFLAIQEAYERLVDADGRLRPASPVPAPRGPAASRDAWRARRTGPASGGGASPAGTGGGPTGDTGHRGRRARPDGDRPHARRGPRKATPGSTTYDEAAETPRDPEWDGGAWYGPSSGTYWTINPREYADPRKHGPEYQARARRAADEEARAAAGAADRASPDGDEVPAADS